MDQLVFKAKVRVFFVAQWGIDLGLAVGLRLLERLLGGGFDVDRVPIEVLVGALGDLSGLVRLELVNQLCFHLLNFLF